MIKLMHLNNLLYRAGQRAQRALSILLSLVVVGGTWHDECGGAFLRALTPDDRDDRIYLIS